MKKIIRSVVAMVCTIVLVSGMSLSVDAAGKANKVKTSATTSSATTAVPETFAATTAGTTLPASVAGLDSIVLPCNDGTGNPRTYPITDSAFQQVQNTMCMATIVIGNPTVAQQMLQQNIAMTQTILNNTAAVYMSCGFEKVKSFEYYRMDLHD